MSTSGVFPQPSYGSINCWGDSLTSGNQDGGGNYCSQLGVLSGLTVVNQGVSGNTSAQILARMQAAPPAANTLNVIWACTNDFNAAGCLANIATMVALVQSQGAQYLILSPLNNDTSANWHGPYGTLYLTQFPSVAQKMQALYPGNFIDIHEMLVNQWDSTYPGDFGSWGWDLAPESYRTHYANTLSADITTTSTCSITFTSNILSAGLSFVVDSEVIQATTISGSTVLTCIRGYMGTTAATHTAKAVTFVDPTHLSSSIGYPFVANQAYEWMLANPSNSTSGVPNLTLLSKRLNALEASLGGYVTSAPTKCTGAYGVGGVCQLTIFQNTGTTSPLVTLQNTDATNRLTTMHFKNASNEWDLGEQGASAVAFQLTDFSNSGAVIWSVARTTDAFSFPAAAGVTITGPVSSKTYSTATNCASSASPAVCGSAAAGAFVIAAGATTVTVNTTAVTANSEIQINNDASLGTRLSVTCNTTLLTAPWQVTARTAGTSFTVAIAAGPITNPECFSYSIVN